MAEDDAKQPLLQPGDEEQGLAPQEENGDSQQQQRQPTGRDAKKPRRRKPQAQAWAKPKEAAATPGSASEDAGIFRLLREARSEAWVLTLATICLIVGSLAMLIFPQVSGALIDACLKATQTHDIEAARKQLREQLLLGSAVLLVGSVFGGLRAWLFEGASARIMTQLRINLFSSIMNQEVAFFDVNRTDL